MTELTPTDSVPTDSAPTGPAPTEPDPAGSTSTGSPWFRAALLVAAIAVLVRYTGWWGLAIVGGLVLMIFLHELGHFIMAKRAGMKVTEFFIGFGPRLWSFQRGETEYGFKAIPAGAYVKIIGMSAAEEIDGADEARTYRAQPFWQRFGVAVAGSTMHFIQALVLIFVILVFAGAPGGALARPVPASNVTQVGDVFAHCPAAAAGIRPDDEIIAIDGQPLRSYDDLTSMIGPLAGKNARFTIRRNGITKTVTVHIVPRAGDAGVGLLGIQYGPKPVPTKRTGPIRAVPATIQEFGTMVSQTIPAFFRSFSLSNLKSYGNQVVNAQQDRSHAESESAHPTTTVLADTSVTGNATGVTTASCQASMGGDAAFKSKSTDTSAQEGRFISIVGIFNIGKGMASSGGVADLLYLFVMVNIFIGVFNLIPMLPFDGGHVVIAMYEKIQEWFRRDGRRYYVDLNKLLPVVYVMILLLGLLFVSSLYLDITNPVSLK